MMILLILLCVPLMQSFVSIGQDIQTKQSIVSSTKNYLQTIDSRIRLVSSSYQIAPTAEKSIDVSLQIQVPQAITLTQDQTRELTQLLAQELDASVNLQFIITPMVSVQKAVASTPTTKELLDTAIANYLNEHDDNISYLASTYSDTAHVYVVSLYTSATTIPTASESQIIQHIQDLSLMTGEIVIDRRQPKVIDNQEEGDATDALIADIRRDLSSYVGTAMVIEEVMLMDALSGDTMASITLTSYTTPDTTKNLLS